MFRRPSLRSTLTTVAAATVLVGGANLASYAATGNPLILGHANKAGTTTSLKNTGRGPALNLNSAKSVPPLVVNSGKLVKHLNADKVDGKSASQLVPSTLRYHLGGPDANVPQGAHYFSTNVPKGTYEISMSGLVTSDNSGDSYQCLIVDRNKILGPTPDVSGIWAVASASFSDPNGGIIDNTDLVEKLTHKTAVIYGCQFSGSGTLTTYRAITFTFRKVNVVNKNGQVFTPRTALHGGGLLHH